MATSILTPSDARDAMIPLAQVKAWAAEANHKALVNLAGALEHAPLDALILALQQACRNGFGSWLVPETDADQQIRPATHLVEIQVLGAQGIGLTVEEAARNWRRCALNLIQAEDAA
jgi:hypothetical protein